MFNRLLCCLTFSVCLIFQSSTHAQDPSALIAFDTVDESTVLLSGYSAWLDSGPAVLMFENQTGGVSQADIVVLNDGSYFALVAPEEVSPSGSLLSLFVFDAITFELLDANNALVVSGPGDGIAEMYEEVFDTLEDAVGCIPPNEVVILETRPTTNPAIIAIGFTQSIRCVANCEIYTVFKNPTTGKFGGVHLSSDQDDE